MLSAGVQVCVSERKSEVLVCEEVSACVSDCVRVSERDQERKRERERERERGKLRMMQASLPTHDGKQIIFSSLARLLHLSRSATL